MGTKHAVAYFRTSSAANVGADKDSLKRQQRAVRAYAAANGIEIVGGNSITRQSAAPTGSRRVPASPPS